ncbi:MAG TPA: L,D-transpeptidase family protein [Phototrophicaceae bacterium]|nr:L,D-transpeptidase family protein [Phototrophicaceae bacterium]
MDVYEPKSKRKTSARERHQARKSRRGSVQEGFNRFVQKAQVALPGSSDRWQRVQLIARDALWYAFHASRVRLGLLMAVGVLALLFAGSHVVEGRIFPNVWALGVNLGDKTIPEAEAALLDAWTTRLQIRLLDGSRSWTATPAELGMQLDTKQVAEAARSVGLSGMPMGYEILPVVRVDLTVAQNYLLDLTAQTDFPPFNAGYEWKDGEVVGVAGRDGRMLDVPQMVDRLVRDPVTVVRLGRVDLLMSTLPPLAADPEPYLEAARAVVKQPPSLLGYDPYKDETVAWSTTPEVFASWLEVTADGLSLRPDTLGAFIQAQNQSLNPSGDLRYLDASETRDQLREAIQTQAETVMLRIHYRPGTYEVVAGDTAYRISRKTGIPYNLIASANEGKDLNVLSPGQVITLPSRDVTSPLPPVPNKRIVVNLDTQSLVAFENGQPVFNWLISSGLSEYPTASGTFQILGHNPVARGSSYTLCSNAGCGEWEMYWFMGVYEVQAGLMNGFHGAVLLPNGAYLGGGNVGSQYTFGCVMSQNDNAKLLYDWAAEGTMVEIISSDYPPQSPLGQQALGLTS